MHAAYLCIYPSRDGDRWSVFCDDCARGSRMSADHSAVRDLLAAHLIDPDTTPVHDIDPDQFVPPAEIANRSTSHL
jgi:hypothetical protein